VRNLVEPLRYEDDATALPGAFVERVRQALTNLGNKQNVTVRFIGYTDSEPLTGRTASIYGDHLALSKARAHRVALAMQEAWAFRARRSSSDGRGDASPIGSNDTRRAGRSTAASRSSSGTTIPSRSFRTSCSSARRHRRRDRDARLRSSVGHDPDAELENGRPIVPAGLAADLRRALGDVSSG
jgi:outer membrane protein OmpA-like peptidoglycan-associated protein